MANTNAPMGLRAVKHYMGGVVRLSEYAIASGLAANIFSGDLVKSTGTTKQITPSAATNVSIGVFYGCEYQEPDGNIVFRRYWPTGQTLATGTTCRAWVMDDPHILFEVQGDATGVAAVDIGNTADVTATAGSTTTGQSAFVLDASSLGASKMLKIIELVPRDDNAYGAYAKVHVLINKHELNASVAGV